ncbi:MAG: hypothetical protein EOP52_13485 [Sphingobacteriales bacterium]|nr:MAG: hypothetical protein EOP52_13485 [Sphingobacteriales bacterium]
MTGFCPDQCNDIELIGNPIGGCPAPAMRKRKLSRLAFMACGIALPSEYTALTTKPLFEGEGRVIFLSSPLANIQLEDPTTEQVVVHDCMPAIEDITGRRLTAEDRIAVEVPIQGGGTDKFGDFIFWKDKRKQWLRMAYGVVYCNGDFMFLRDENGNLISGSLQAHTGYQALTANGANSGTIEFTKVSLNVNGDPFSFAKPDFNLKTFGINV